MKNARFLGADGWGHRGETPIGVVGAKPLLLKELERSLLGLESKFTKRTDTTKPNRMLLLTNDATLLCLHQILARQPPRGLTSSPVPYLRL